jgi:hypothetical protein
MERHGLVRELDTVGGRLGQGKDGAGAGCEKDEDRAGCAQGLLAAARAPQEEINTQQKASIECGVSGPWSVCGVWSGRSVECGVAGPLICRKSAEIGLFIHHSAEGGPSTRSV